MSDLKRINIINQLLVEKHENVLEHMFDTKKLANLSPQEIEGGRVSMRGPAEDLLDNAFSGGENVMLKVAIDVWNGDGETKLDDLLRLDPDNFMSVLVAWKSRYYL